MPQYNIRAPALPLPTNDYQQMQQDQFQYVLRLYFNRLDTYNNATTTAINSQNVLIWLGSM
jgi:hypothetical protein